MGEKKKKLARLGLVGLGYKFQRNLKNERHKPIIMSVMLIVVVSCLLKGYNYLHKDGSQLYVIQTHSIPLPSPKSELGTSRFIQNAPITPTVRKCSREEAEFQASRIAVAKIRGCPPADDIWMRLVQLMMPKATVFVDIGSNKGYSAARFFSLWNPELGLTAQKWQRTLFQVSNQKEVLECGACRDCKEDTEALTHVGTRMCGKGSLKTSNPNSIRSLGKAVGLSCTRRKDNYMPIRVYSFDGNALLVDALNDGIRYLTGNSDKIGLKDALSDIFLTEYLPENSASLLEKFWSVELQAFSDVYEPGKTLTFVQNGEMSHIEDNLGDNLGTSHQNFRSNGKRVTVPVLTVDQLMIRDGLEFIDFLKIDTEGHDLMVLEGAQNALSQHKVTVIMFELNNFWPKVFKGSSSPLKRIITDLEEKDYVCYLEGKNLMLRLSFCWDDIIEQQKVWSNIWCASAHSTPGKAIISVFDSYSVAFN